MGLRTFVCDECGRLYAIPDSWTVADKHAEMLERYGGELPEAERATVCDYCYERTEIV